MTTFAASDIAKGLWVVAEVDGWRSDHLTATRVSDKAVCLSTRGGRSAWFPKSWIKAFRTTTTYVVFELKPFYRLFSEEQKLVLGHTF